MSGYSAEFLWPNKKGSIEEAGYEFANAKTEDYRHEWWRILVKRIADRTLERALEKVTTCAVAKLDRDNAT
jgi:hypothetical protein